MEADPKRVQVFLTATVADTFRHQPDLRWDWRFKLTVSEGMQVILG